MDGAMSAPARPLALRFLSGRLEGGLVPLKPGCALIVGRQPGADLLLTEDLVSRRHACLTLDGDGVMLEDLGSTNGTFLNGARITRARVVEGDRVLVGESIFTLVAREPARQASATEVRSLPYRATVTAERQPATAIEGRLDEVPLHDLLQLLATARKSGVLVIRTDAHEAEVRLERGRVIGCALDRRGDLSPQKVLFRLFGWTSGQFELRPAGISDVTQVSMAESLDALLMEAARQVDEMRRLRSTLPGHFAVNEEFPEVALDEDDRALVSVAARLRSLDAILDATPLLDVAAAERLASLRARGVLLDDPGPG
jgi:hypothetical protein